MHELNRLRDPCAAIFKLLISHSFILKTVCVMGSIQGGLVPVQFLVGMVRLLCRKKL